MKKIRVFAIAILALLTFGISVSAEVLNRPAYWEFDVAQNLPVLVIKSEKMPILTSLFQPHNRQKITFLSPLRDNRRLVCRGQKYLDSSTGTQKPSCQFEQFGSMKG